MTIPGEVGALPSWLSSFPDRPRARLEASIGQLRDQFPYPGAWCLIDDAALGRFRQEEAAAAREQYRLVRSIRAACQWESLRGLEVEEQAGRLMARPAATVRLLESSMPGIRWLVEKWRWLILALDKAGDWNEPLQRQAQRLCGIPSAFEPADPRGIRDGSIDDRRALALGEIARLEALLTPEMEAADASDRQAAIDATDLPDDATYRRIARAERDGKRIYDLAIASLNQIRDRIEAEKAEAEAEAESEAEIAGEVDADDPPAETARKAPTTASRRRVGRRPRRCSARPTERPGTANLARYPFDPQHVPR